MSRRFLIVAVAIFSLLAYGAGVWRSAAVQDTPQEVHREPVVVELFTSEGCSSCPPADKLLAQLAANSNLQNPEVIALEEHVDYWDSLGWVDPFSSHQATERQVAYSRAYGNGNVYTPQMVVDGQTEFVGSRKIAAERAIAEAGLAKKVAVRISRGPKTGSDGREFHIQVGRISGDERKNAQVWLAVTESSLHSDVLRGENAGETLYHGPVVRSLTNLGAAAGTGDASFGATSAVRCDLRWKAENLKVVVFVQDSQSKRILGASRIRYTE